MATYFYIGSTTGSLTNVSDWSVTEGGEPLETLVPADGDEFHIATSATLSIAGTSSSVAVKLVVSADVVLTGSAGYLSGVELAAGATLTSSVSLYIVGRADRFFTAKLGAGAAVVFTGEATWIVNDLAVSARTSSNSSPRVDFTRCDASADFGVLTFGEMPSGSISANYYLGTETTPFPLPPCRIKRLVLFHGGQL